MDLVSKIRRVFKKVTFFYFPYDKKKWYSECLISEKPSQVTFYPVSQINILTRTSNFDSDGIPVFEGYQSLKMKHHPCMVCQYALGLYEKYLLSNSTDKESIEKFLKQANWLYKTAASSERGTGWPIEDGFNLLSLEDGWFSAMFQGQGMSVLSRAYLVTNDEKYLDVAEKALWAFEKSVWDGGVAVEFKGNTVYEEYPTKSKPNISLNGLIFALYGLFELSLMRPKSKAGELYETGINSLKKILPLYDMGFWSQYYLFNYPQHYAASFEYHSLHIEQLLSLYYLTGDTIFKEYSDKFLSYKNNYIFRTKALLSKTTKNHD